MTNPYEILGVAQEIVGAGDFLEFLFGFLVTGIKIRVQLLRQLAVRFLDIGGRSRRGDAKNLVRICHDPLRLKTTIGPPQAESASEIVAVSYRSDHFIPIGRGDILFRNTISTLIRRSRQLASMCAEERVSPIWLTPTNGYLMALRHKANCRQT